MQKVVSCVTRLACDLKQTHYVANVSIMPHNAISQQLKWLVVTQRTSLNPELSKLGAVACTGMDTCLYIGMQ